MSLVIVVPSSHRAGCTSSGARIAQALRGSVFGTLMRQEVAFFDRSRTGELVNRLSADTALVSQTVTTNISDGLRATATAAASVSMMVSDARRISRATYKLQAVGWLGNGMLIVIH